jgi:hypothetical protein
MSAGCERFYLVKSGNDCFDIALDAGISLTTFYSYNPGVGSSCGTLQAGCYVCIGISGPPVTITSGTPYGPTPSPIRKLNRYIIPSTFLPTPSLSSFILKTKLPLFARNGYGILLCPLLLRRKR